MKKTSLNLMKIFYLKIHSPLYEELRIHRLYLLQKSKIPSTKKGCPEYDSKLHLIARLQLWGPGFLGSTSSLPLLPGPLRFGMVVHVS